MGKIEDTFGSRENADVFLFNAMDQPFLRLRLDPTERASEGGDLIKLTAEAHTGYTIGNQLLEPAAPNLPEPQITIKRSFTATLWSPSLELPHDIGPNDYSASHTDSRYLRIMRPSISVDHLHTQVTSLIEGRPTTSPRALTVIRASLIDGVLEELEKAATENNNASVLLKLSKVALGGTWL